MCVRAHVCMLAYMFMQAYSTHTYMHTHMHSLHAMCRCWNYTHIYIYISSCSVHSLTVFTFTTCQDMEPKIAMVSEEVLKTLAEGDVKIAHLLARIEKDEVLTLLLPFMWLVCGLVVHVFNFRRENDLRDFFTVLCCVAVMDSSCMVEHILFV